VHEADEPDLVGDLLHPDILAGEHVRQVDFLPSEADAAAAGDSDRSIMEAVVKLLQATIGGDLKGRRARPGTSCRGPGVAAPDCSNG
jgi:hypothetical protein